jgi:outer membrane protein
MLLGMSSQASIAQNFAYVDMDYILQNLPAYQDAQKELDNLSKQWQREIEQRYEAIDRLYKAYEAEKVLLSEEMKQKREDEILKKEQEARELQRQRFGVEGDLYKKRQQLLEPIQNDIYQAVKDLADGSGYDIVFDKSGQSNILYGDPRYDKSDRILRKLGISESDIEEKKDTDRGSGSRSNSNSRGNNQPNFPPDPRKGKR